MGKNSINEALEKIEKLKMGVYENNENAKKELEHIYNSSEWRSARLNAFEILYRYDQHDRPDKYNYERGKNIALWSAELYSKIKDLDNDPKNGLQVGEIVFDEVNKQIVVKNGADINHFCA